jgi:hypothetical protein
MILILNNESIPHRPPITKPHRTAFPNLHDLTDQINFVKSIHLTGRAASPETPINSKSNSDMSIDPIILKKEILLTLAILN